MDWSLYAAAVLVAATGAGALLYIGKEYGDAKKWQKWLCRFLAAAALALFFCCSLVRHTAVLRSFMHAEVLLWLGVLTYCDLKEQKISNRLILAGIGFWLLLTVLEITAGKGSLRQLLLYSAGGMLISFLLLLVAFAVKSALGMGDVKLFFVLGLLYGLSDTYSILLFTVILMAFLCIILLAAKKVTKKTKIPMAPFVLIGFILNIILEI